MREIKVNGFLDRSLEGDWPYLWLDATYVKVREAGRIVSVAVTVAVAVNDQGRREVLGMAIGASEAEAFWTEFLRSLARRGLCGVKLLISDDHKGLRAAATRILGATWQRCRVHFARNLLAHAGRQGRRVVSAFVATAFAQEDADSAKAQWRQVADQLRPKVPKLAVLMDEAEHDVLAYMTFPKEHRQKLHSTNPIERLHAEEDLRAVMRGEIRFASKHPRYRSVVLSPGGGAAMEISLPGVAEYPRIDPRRTGQRHRKTFALSGSGSEDGWPFRRVASIDPEQGAIDGWTYPRDQIPEEHVFVPRGEAEGDGWLIGPHLDVGREATGLNVFDAKHISEGPVWQGILPYPLPLGLHGTFAKS